MAQTLSDAVVGPAPLTHIRLGVGVQMRVTGGGLDLVGLFDGITLLVLMVTHGSSVAPGP